MKIRVSGLYYYPIKSCAGTTIQSAELGERGIMHDREWMVVDAENEFVTQRELQKMCLIHPTVSAATGKLCLHLEAPGMDHLEVPATDAYGTRDVTVWRDICKAHDQGDAAAAWLTKFLGTNLRLVRMCPDYVRQVDQKFAQRTTDQVGFADGFPLLLISEASLEDLNSRLTRSIEMNRFRPNVVVTGCGAFAEDEWHTIQIGRLKLDVVKPCARCVITTVDQTTGVSGTEPLKTLAEFRHSENTLLFGQNVVHQSPGGISIGDEVEVLN